MRFLVYTPEGIILRHGNCPEEFLSLQAKPGEIVMEDCDNNTDENIHKIVNGKRVQK
jgi:hypothetical protein